RHTRSKRDWSSDVCSSDLKREVSNPLSMSVIARSRMFLITLFKSCLWVDKADLSQFTIPERSCRTRPRKEVVSTGAVLSCISLEIGGASCREREALAEPGG